MIKCWLLALGLSGVSCFAVAAEDSWATVEYQYASRQLDNFMSRFQDNFVDPVLRGVRAAKPRAAKAVAPTSGDASFFAAGGTAVPPRNPRLPQQMAAAYPSDKRAQVQRTFEELLTGYQRVERQVGVEPYDVASGAAAFIAGSYAAFHHAEVPDENFKPLVQQLQQILAADPGWSKVSVAAKQDMYEHLAIFGMLMAATHTALKKQPDAKAQAAMQVAARGYLEQFLKVDAAKVQLTAQGLSVR